MATSYPISDLEFDSQIQLLSRLQFVTRFSSNFVQITGEQGAGKTWLSERYLESWAQEPIQSFLVCHANQQDVQHRAILLRQLIPDGIFNAKDTLASCLDRMLDGDGIHALLVIDDGQHLSPSLIAELWELIIQSQCRQNWQINVLLFCRSGKVSKYLQKVSFTQGIQPLELEISPLTESEREVLLNVILASEELGAAERRFLKKKLATIASLPGLLIDAQKMGEAVMEEPKKRSILSIVASVVGLAVILSGGWMYFQSTEESLILPQPGSITQLSSELENPAVEDAIPSPVNIDIVPVDSHQTDDFALPKVPVIQGLTVGRGDRESRVVVPDEIVDAMLDEQATGGDGTTAVKQLAKPVSEEITSEVPRDAEQAMKELLSPVKLSMANSVLLNIPKNRFTLQLAALQSIEAVTDFIRVYDLEGKVSIYETKRKGQPWYMVLIGDYPSINAAREAGETLPDEVKQLGPWAKSFVQIHKEIQVDN